MKSVAWTAEEHRILEKCYPSGGAAAVHERLPNRTVTAISLRASLAGIRRERVAEVRKVVPLAKAPAVREKNVPSKKRPAVFENYSQAKAFGALEELYGKTASTKPGLQAVPDSEIGLPWVSYPRDPQTARSVVAILTKLAGDSIVEKLGHEAVRFFESHAAHLNARSERSESEKAAA